MRFTLFTLLVIDSDEGATVLSTTFVTISALPNFVLTIACPLVRNEERRRRGAVQVSFLLGSVSERRRRREVDFAEDRESPINDCVTFVFLFDFFCAPKLGALFFLCSLTVPLYLRPVVAVFTRFVVATDAFVGASKVL